MTITTEGIEARDLEALSRFALARIIPTWNPDARERHDFITSVAHICIMATQKRADGEVGTMVMDFSGMTSEARAELAAYVCTLRGEAVTEGNCAAAEFFARIENLLEAEQASRRELERIFSLS